jgi:CheY-like chemotaxis protein
VVSALSLSMANERPRVLLVDPDHDQRNRVTTVLAIAGYHVVEVASGRMLLDAIERSRVDVPVVIVAGSVCDELDLSHVLACGTGTAPVVALPRGRLAARRITAGPIIESSTAPDELVHTVDHAFAAIDSAA